MRRQQDETYLQDENFHWNRTEVGWLQIHRIQILKLIFIYEKL